jgi:hypothetical protein
MRKITVLLILLSLVTMLVPVTSAQMPGFEPVTLCHWAGNPAGTVGQYVVVTVDNQGAYNGHLGHSHDIIPIPGEGCPDGEDDDDDLGIICIPPQFLNEDKTGCLDPEPDPDLCPWNSALPIDSDLCIPPDNNGDDDGGNTGDPFVYVPGPDLEEVTVWSNLPAGGVAWVIRDAFGTLHPIVHPDGTLVITPIEFRDRFNRDQGVYESGHPMSRLVLGSSMPADPDNYLAFNPLTGHVVGVWVEVNDEHAQSEDFGSGAVAGTSVNIITGQKWVNGVRVR